jgi:hypothetical protein
MNKLWRGNGEEGTGAGLGTFCVLAFLAYHIREGGTSRGSVAAAGDFVAFVTFVTMIRAAPPMTVRLFDSGGNERGGAAAPGGTGRPFALLTAAAGPPDLL